MTSTTVLSDDVATVIRQDAGSFHWGAVIAGAVIAVGVTFFLLSLGSGVGLALVSVPRTSAAGWKAFLTLGAIYVFAAQAFGFAIGGHVTGRLMGPSIALHEEEEFRSDAHGLAVWALAIAGGLALLFIAAGAGISSGATAKAAAIPAGYWTDKLFRPAGPLQQSAAQLRQYAQVASPDATDAARQAQPIVSDAPATPAPDNSAPAAVPGNSDAPIIAAPNLADDKQVASRILPVDVAAAPGSDGSDRRELVRLVMQDTGLTVGAATDRVNGVEGQMRDNARQLADQARKAASYVSIWTALSLLFGAIVCVAATISARWEEDKLHFSWARR